MLDVCITGFSSWLTDYLVAVVMGGNFFSFDASFAAAGSV